MPYTAKQNRMFQAAAHNPEFAAKVGIPVKQAQEMASEGIKRGDRSRGALMAAQMRKK